jgi:hypothetical protein
MWRGLGNQLDQVSVADRDLPVRFWRFWCVVGFVVAKWTVKRRCSENSLFHNISIVCYILESLIMYSSLALLVGLYFTLISATRDVPRTKS